MTFSRNRTTHSKRCHLANNSELKTSLNLRLLNRDSKADCYTIASFHWKQRFSCSPNTKEVPSTQNILKKGTSEELFERELASFDSESEIGAPKTLLYNTKHCTRHPRCTQLRITNVAPRTAMRFSSYSKCTISNNRRGTLSFPHKHTNMLLRPLLIPQRWR